MSTVQRLQRNVGSTLADKSAKNKRLNSPKKHDETRRLNRLGRTAKSVLKIPRLHNSSNARNTILRITHKLRSHARQNDSSCPSCRATGHNFGMVKVRIGRHLRALSYCICCGERIPSQCLYHLDNSNRSCKPFYLPLLPPNRIYTGSYSSFLVRYVW